MTYSFNSTYKVRDVFCCFLDMFYVPRCVFYRLFDSHFKHIEEEPYIRLRGYVNPITSAYGV